MAYELKEGQGSLFQEERQSDRQPSHRGSILLEGKTYDLAAWERTSKGGKTYISIQATPRKKDSSKTPSEQPGQQPPQGHPLSASDFDNNDLPF